MRRRSWGVVFASSILVACGSAQTAAEPAPTQTPVPLLDVEPETPWSACLKRIETLATPSATVEKVGRVCGIAGRQRALGPVREGRQTEADATDRYTFRAERAGACFRVYAIGGEGVEELGIEVVDPAGRVVATDGSRGSLAAAPRREPLCVESPGVYTVEVTVTRGGGGYALQVWTHQRPAGVAEIEPDH